MSAWVFEGDCDANAITSKLYQIKWPQRSGRQIEIPEIDRGRWFSIQDAAEHIVKGQAPLLQLLAETIRISD